MRRQGQPGGNMLRPSRSLDGPMRPPPVLNAIKRQQSSHALSRLPLEWASPLKSEGRVLDFFAHEYGPDCCEAVSVLENVKLNKRTVKTLRLWMCRRNGDRGVFHVRSPPRSSQGCLMLPWEQLALRRVVIRGVPLDKGSALRAPFNCDIAKRLKELVVVFDPPEKHVESMAETLLNSLPHSLLDVPKLRVTLVFKPTRPGDRWPVNSRTGPIPSLPFFSGVEPRFRKDMETVYFHATGGIIQVAHRILSKNTTLHLTFVNLTVLSRPQIHNSFGTVASELLTRVERRTYRGENRAELKDIATRLKFKDMNSLATGMPNQVFTPKEHGVWSKPSALYSDPTGSVLGLSLH